MIVFANTDWMKYKNKDAGENDFISIVKEIEISSLTITNVKNKIKNIRTSIKNNNNVLSSTEIILPKAFRSSQNLKGKIS